MKTVLLPTDFSDNARHAIDYAIKLFGTTNVFYILLKTFYTPDAGATMMYSVSGILLDEANKEMAALEKALRAEHGPELHIKKKILEATVAEGCDQIVKTQDIDLIVMGTKGATGLKEVLMGSNTTATIQKVHCPVLAIPEEAVINLPTTLAFATDYKDIKSEKIIKPLVSVLGISGAELTVVRVLPEDEEARKKAVSTDVKLPHLLSVFPHKLEVIYEDDVIAGLEKYIEHKQPDMFVMLEHTYGFFEGLFHKSTTKRIAMHVSVPLLVLQDEN